jgi:hypothetical protein
MALPVLDKTWEIGIVELRTLGFGNSQQDMREAMYQLKESLVTGGAAPWTVEYSCDGVTAGTPGDAVDRWGSRADVSFGSVGIDGQSGISWIVLKQAGLLANFQLMIKCDSVDPTSATICEIYYSPNAGFTGGTTVDASGRPTATDEESLALPNSGWLHGATFNNSVREFILYTFRSTDGQCTRIFAWNVTEQRHCLHVQLDLAKNPIPEWTEPVICGWTATTATTLHTYGSYNDSQSLLKSSHPSSGAMQLYLTGEGYVASQGGQNHTLANDLNSEYAIYPMGVASLSLNAKGRHGEVFDMWWIPVSLVNYSTMPLTPSATREFMVFDDMLLPHDGSVPIIL